MYNEKYICARCDRAYDEDSADVRIKKEYRGECHGAPAYEKLEYICCPYCGSDRYEEATMEDNVAEHINELVDQRDSWENQCKKLHAMVEKEKEKKDDKATARAYIYR